MPEMHFRVRWPDGRRTACYSPSRVVRDYFEVGQAYSVEDFVARSRSALTQASDRVRAKFGAACPLALGQLAEIEATARLHTQSDATVTVEAFEN